MTTTVEVDIGAVRAKIVEYIIYGDTELALKELIDLCYNYNRVQFNAAALISASYYDLVNNSIGGTLTYDERTRHMASVRNRILEMTDLVVNRAQIKNAGGKYR